MRACRRGEGGNQKQWKGKQWSEGEREERERENIRTGNTWRETKPTWKENEEGTRGQGLRVNADGNTGAERNSIRMNERGRGSERERGRESERGTKAAQEGGYYACATQQQQT